MPRWVMPLWLRASISTIQLGCAAHLFTTYFLSLSSVGGPSMLPTLAVHGDWVAVDMRARHGRNVRVGDLVIYKIPIAKYEMGLKRVIGLPGDYVCFADADSPAGDRMIQIPEGHCWIEGDNLEVSRDSRYFGPLPLALIAGKAFAKVLPWDERQWLTNPIHPVDQTPSVPDVE